MAKSLAAQIAELERVVAANMAGETIIPVQLIVIESRASAEALADYKERHPEPSPRPASGRVKLVLLPCIIATEFLRQHGIDVPPENEPSELETTAVREVEPAYELGLSP